VAQTSSGPGGPREGEPVFYHWPWYWHLARLGPWLLLAGAIAVPKRNRDRRTLLIFIPLAILSLLWPLVTSAVNPGSADANEALPFESLAVGLALFWLHADRLTRYRSVVRLPVSLGLLLLAGLVTLVSAGWKLSDPTLIIFLISVVVLGAILLATLAITRRLIHRRYVPFRFMLWLGAWNLLLTTAAVVLFAVVFLLLLAPELFELRIILLQGVGGGLMLGLCLYALNLPYMLLMFSSPFFRRRFQDWLGLKVG
jgi:NADH:ubiquinone oxidoreductase subunit K